MVKNTPEYLVQEVFDQYGIEVPLETVITLLEPDPYLKINQYVSSKL